MKTFKVRGNDVRGLCKQDKKGLDAADINNTVD